MGYRAARSDDGGRRGERTRSRRRRRRLRVVQGIGRLVFWILVLAAVFVFGLGFGRTIAGDDKVAREEVTITQDRGTVTATLPVRTVTATTVRTVTVRRPTAGSRGSELGGPADGPERG